MEVVRTPWGKTDIEFELNVSRNVDPCNVKAIPTLQTTYPMKRDNT